jgi:ATP-dependent Clp protease ATP-binding subunit ClpA
MSARQAVAAASSADERAPRVLWELYTARARLVIVVAQAEARVLGCEQIAGGHLLLGLLGEGSGVAARLLGEAQIEAPRLRETLGRGPRPADDPLCGRIPFTASLELALEAAQRSHHGYVGSEHLLRALLDEGGAEATDVLSRAGADVAALRAVLTSSLALPPRRRISRARSPAAASQGTRQVLAGLTEGALGLLAEADATARSLGAEAIGTDHLLVAMMQSRGDLARRLDGAGLTLGEVRAHVADGGGGDDDARSDASTSCLSLPCTKQVQRAAELARQYAIVDERDDVPVDYLLLGIANDAKSAAYDILQHHDPAGLVDAIVDEVGSPDGPSVATLTQTAREALELAWSTALALGYSEICVSHILGGLREPGWTIAARAIAMLADPQGRPARPRGARAAPTNSTTGSRSRPTPGRLCGSPRRPRATSARRMSVPSTCCSASPRSPSTS